MKLTHLSASSLKVWFACNDQWVDRYVNRNRGSSTNEAAEFGSKIHDALEEHVKSGDYQAPDSWERLRSRWADLSHGNIADKLTTIGEELLAHWHDRQDWSEREVVSTEQKWTFPILHRYGETEFQFIIDRVDRVNGRLEVVDYKSGNFMLGHDEMKTDIQALSYGTAAWIEVPDQPIYWVTFDYLRDMEIGVGFRPSELEAFYDKLVRTAEQIIEMDQELVVPTLNPGCRFCHKKIQCDKLSSVAAPYVAITGMDQGALARKRIDLAHAKPALEALIKEIDAELIPIFEADDTLEHIVASVDPFRGVTLANRNQRYVDMDAVRMALADDEIASFAKLGVKEVEELARQANEDGQPIRAEALKKALKKGKSRASIKPVGS